MPTPSIALRVALAVSAVSTLLLAGGCESNPAQPAASASPVVPKAQLQFADLQGFDQELSTSLAAPLPAVSVAFYDRITPSAVPERLQKWMAAVEAGGGKVKITQPPSTVTAKSPFLLISAVSAAFDISKASKAASAAAQFKPAQSYDADILLKVDDRGDTVVDRVVFTQRGK